MRTSGYHPQTNGQCKCFNVILINMLGTLPKNPKSTWREQVPTLVHAYNCTRNNATGFSPNYLMFGWKPHLLIDLIFGANTVNLKVTALLTLKILKRGWNGHIKLQMMLLRRNRKGKNNVMTTSSDAQN